MGVEIIFIKNFLLIDKLLVLVLAVFDDNNVLDRRSTTCFIALYAIITLFAGKEKDDFP